jgi:hypothetical protein
MLSPIANDPGINLDVKITGIISMSRLLSSRSMAADSGLMDKGVACLKDREQSSGS